MKKIVLWVVLGIAVVALAWMGWNWWPAKGETPGRKAISGIGAKKADSAGRSDSAAARAGGQRKEAAARSAKAASSAKQAVAPPSVRAEDIASLAQWTQLVRSGADAGELMDWLDDFLLSDPDAVRQMRALLRGEDVAFRLKVAQWLGRLGTSQAAELLIGMVNDETDDRAGAEYSDILSGWRAAGSAGVLLASLSEDNAYMATLGCVRALGGMMNENLAAQLLDAYFGSATEAEQRLVADAICHVTNPESVATLVGLLANTRFLAPDDPFRTAAYNALASIGTVAAVEALFKDAGMEKARDRTSILEAIGLVNNEDSLELVIAQATGKAGMDDSEIQAAAIRALSNYGVQEDRIRQLLLSLSGYETDPAVISAANRTLRILSGDDSGE